MKDLQWTLYSVFVLILASHVKCDLSELKECLNKDSISCLQMQLFRNAKELMNQESIDLLGGMSLVRDADEGNREEGRAGKSLELLEMEEKVENATDIISRQEAIENFLVRKARNVVVERTIRWDVGQTLQNILNFIPEAYKGKFTNYVTEARGKGKRFLRIMLPLLIGLKLKMAGMAALTYLGIAVLAKKALLASLISLVVTGFIGLKKLLSTKHSPYEELAVAQYPVHGWGPAPMYDHHGDYAPQKLAYNSHVPMS